MSRRVALDSYLRTMSWRETWRETVESFLREVRDPGAGPDEPTSADPVVAAVAQARAEIASAERELGAALTRHAAETDAALLCERRRRQAERIGDPDTARVAERFGQRHAARAEVLARKCAVLEDELALARTALNDLLDYARVEAKPPTERTR